MKRKIFMTMLTVALICWSTSFSAYAAGPDFFTAAIYADGTAWATKGLSDLPAPNEYNQQSFDLLFGFVNGADGQLAVSEAGPGNPLYNGGRWDLQLAMWLIADPPVVVSYDEVMWHVAQGDLVTTPAYSYFLCPLLPLK